MRSLCAYGFTLRVHCVYTGATRDGPRNAPDDTVGHDLSPGAVGIGICTVDYLTDVTQSVFLLFLLL